MLIVLLTSEGKQIAQHNELLSYMDNVLKPHTSLDFRMLRHATAKLTSLWAWNSGSIREVIDVERLHSRPTSESGLRLH